MPGWTVELIKITGTIVIALALGYVRFSTVENKVADHSLAIAEWKVKSESNKDAISQTSQKISTLEVQQTLVSGEFRDSLKRIEDDVKELKLDFKNGKPKVP